MGQFVHRPASGANWPSWESRVVLLYGLDEEQHCTVSLVNRGMLRPIGSTMSHVLEVI